MLEDLVNCQRCNFFDKNYPPLSPSLHTSKAKLFYIGENPSWEFGQRVPFDYLTNSGKALFENYIVPLKEVLIFEKNIWITDLFKCRYPKKVINGKSKHSIESNDNICLCARTWLLKELESVTPKIIVTLGDKEVFQRLKKIFKISISGTFNEISYKKLDIQINNQKYYLVPACHPDISSINNLKQPASKKWSEKHKNEYLTVIKGILNEA